MNLRWNLTGRRALVTGGTKGIGNAVAQGLLDLGAQVLIVARDATEVAAAVADWTRQGLPAAGLAADVSPAAGRTVIFDYLEQFSSPYTGSRDAIVGV